MSSVQDGQVTAPGLGKAVMIGILLGLPAGLVVGVADSVKFLAAGHRGATASGLWELVPWEIAVVVPAFAVIGANGEATPIQGAIKGNSNLDIKLQITKVATPG